MSDSPLPLNLAPEPDEPLRTSATAEPTRKPLPKGLTFGQIARLDPALCDVSPFNGRDAGNFNPIANQSLIDSIRERGQQVPAIVRSGTTAGRLEVVAGTRRLGAVRYLRAMDPEFTLLAEVRDLDDQQAWSLAETENADRQDITDLERAKNWKLAVENLFGGSQSALARSLGVDKSVVSRMISLATLPEVITKLVARPEGLRAHFAEKLAPHLKDEERRSEILGIAGNLAEAGVQLAPAELIRRLVLSPADAEAFRAVSIGAGRVERQAIWQRKPNGSSQIIIKPVPPELSREERKTLLKELTERLRVHIERD